MQRIEARMPYDEWNRLATEGAFEEVMEALQQVVAHLESGDLRLDDAVSCYELGTLLSRRCEHLLADAELRISRLDVQQDDSSGQLGFLSE